MEKKKPGEFQITYVRDLKNGMKNINLLVIVLEMG